MTELSKPTDLTFSQVKLFEAISHAVGMLQEGSQMHTADMTKVFEWWAKWSREATSISDRQ